MTTEERKCIHDTLNGMIGRKYLYDGTDVVTVKGITVDGDAVTVDTDMWTDKFDITDFDDWGGKFVGTLRKSDLIVGMETSIMEKTELIVAKDAEITELKKQLTVMRNVMNSPSPLKQQPQPETKPAAKRHESVYPRVFEMLFDTAASVAEGKIGLDQSAEVRQCCKLIAEVSEVQSKVISFSRKPTERKMEINKR